MSKLNPTTSERLAVLEEQRAEDRKKLDEIDGKIDDLLKFKYKGAGAFWLASFLFGTGFVSLLGLFTNWFHSK